MKVSCMGGWCAKRDMCARYGSGDPTTVERICEPGSYDSFESIKGPAQQPAPAPQPAADPETEPEPVEVRSSTVKFRTLEEFRKLKPGDAPVTLAEIGSRSGAIKAVVQQLAKDMAQAGMLNVEMVRNANGSGRLALYSAGPRLHEDGLISIRVPIRLEVVRERVPPGGLARAEMMVAMGRSLEDHASQRILREWIAAGEMFAHRHYLSKGSFSLRYFRTAADMQAWIDAEAKNAALLKAERAAARRANAAPKKAKTERARAPAKPRPPKVNVSNRIAKALPKSKETPVKEVPPALLPGDPVFTEDTKREVRATPPPYRHFVDKPPEVGFSSGRIGEYTEPASRWVKAAMA